MKKWIFLTLLCTFGILSSCDVMKQVGSSYNMVNCKYDYKSITNLSVAGIDAAQGLSILNIAKVTSILTGNSSSIPLNMTLNLNVTNPNPTEALLNGVQYLLSIDGIEFTSGSISQQFSVPAGQTNVLPLAIGFDLARLMTGDSKDAAVNAVKNFIGIGNTKSAVKLQIKPSFLVNGYTVASPVYIPVEFSFGG